MTMESLSSNKSLSVVSRLGVVVPYDDDRVRRAVLLAFNASDEKQISEVESIISAVREGLLESIADTVVSVSEVTKTIENTLMSWGYYDVARSFIEYRAGRDMVRAEPDSTVLSDYIINTTYTAAGESWPDCVDRSMGMYMPYTYDPSRGEAATPDKWISLEDLEMARSMIVARDVFPAMRSLQFGGSEMLRKQARMYNCSGTLVNRLSAFSESLYLLLCGCGVGFSVRRRHTSLLPTVVAPASRVRHHIVEDTIEGWADALHSLLVSYTDADYGSVCFSYHLIRPEGAALSSGGVAPGHTGLALALDRVRGVLSGAVGRGLRPIECFDIMCMAAAAVQSGGIRRSALIAIFDPWDMEMLQCKSGWGWTSTSPWRQFCNVSAGLVENSPSNVDTIREGMRLSVQFGEPGYYIFPSENSKGGEAADSVCNPCGEIWFQFSGAEDATFGFCNLTEVNLATCGSGPEGEEEFLSRVRVAALLGCWQTRLCNTIGYLHPDTTERLRMSPLLGVSISGIYDNLSLVSKEVLNAGRAVVHATASAFFPGGVERGCCVKPSGTASLAFGGISAGCTPNHSSRHFRRVRIRGERDRWFAGLNSHMVEQSSYGDVVVFPVRARGLTLSDVSDREHVSLIRMLMEEWADQSVSCTVSTDDPMGLVELLPGRGGLTFVPRNFDKMVGAPRESVTTPADEVKWSNLIGGYKAVDWRDYKGRVDHLSSVACDGDKCSLVTPTR